MVEIESIIIPAASAILHLLPSPSGGKTKSGAYTLGQLQAASGTAHFTIVAPISLLEFNYSSELPSVSIPPVQHPDTEMCDISSTPISDPASSDDELSEEEPEVENVNLDMLEAHGAAASKDKGAYFEPWFFFVTFIQSFIQASSKSSLHLQTLPHHLYHHCSFISVTSLSHLQMQIWYSRGCKRTFFMHST